MEFAPEMPDKWQSQFIKSATEEADPQPVCLTKGGFPAIVQRGAEDQRGGLYAETKLLAEGRQLDTPARSDEQLPSHFVLQGAYRLRDRRLGERESPRRLSKMQICCDRQEAVDLRQLPVRPCANRSIVFSDWRQAYASGMWSCNKDD